MEKSQPRPPNYSPMLNSGQKNTFIMQQGILYYKVAVQSTQNRTKTRKRQGSQLIIIQGGSGA